MHKQSQKSLINCANSPMVLTEGQRSSYLICNYIRYIYFTFLQVEDQMVLLQSCWSELLVLDHLCRQVTYGKEGCIYLVTGQQVEFNVQCKCCHQTKYLDIMYHVTLYRKFDSDHYISLTQIEVSTIISQAGVTLSGLVSRTQDLVSKLKALQFDRHEFVCLKYLVLFNPGEVFLLKVLFVSYRGLNRAIFLNSCSCAFCFFEPVYIYVLCTDYEYAMHLASATDVKSVQSRRQVEQTQERVNRALMEHTQRSHPGHSDKFGQLLLRLPEVRSISLQVEEYLYQRHLLGDLPCNSLLTEMLHTKHS